MNCEHFDICLCTYNFVCNSIFMWVTQPVIVLYYFQIHLSAFGAPTSHSLSSSSTNLRQNQVSEIMMIKQQKHMILDDPPSRQLHQPLGFGREFRRLHGAQVWQQSFSHQNSLLLHYKSEAAGQLGGSNSVVSCRVHISA